MIIDFHTHIFSDAICNGRDGYLSDKQFSVIYNSEKARCINHATLIDHMDESGIDYSVVMGFPWSKEKFCHEQNEYFSGIMGPAGGRILPFGSVPLCKGSSISAWVKSIKDLGLCGIGEISFYCDGMNHDNEEYLRGIMDAASRYSLPVCLHVNEPLGHEYTGKYNPDLSRLYAIILDFPLVEIILAHWGGGLLFYELMPEVQKSFKNCYYDTAASPYLYHDRIYEIAVKIVGPDKILFGSDYPLITFARYRDSIMNTIDNEDDVNKILGKNAESLLKIKP